MFYAQGYFLVYVMFYSNKGWQIVLSTLTYFSVVLFNQTVILQNENFIAVGEILSLLMMSFFFFAGSCLLAILLVYITDLHVLLRKYIDQSTKLLDGMHEGLLIISNRAP